MNVFCHKLYISMFFASCSYQRVLSQVVHINVFLQVVVINGFCHKLHISMFFASCSYECVLSQVVHINVFCKL